MKVIPEKRPLSLYMERLCMKRDMIYIIHEKRPLSFVYEKMEMRPFSFIYEKQPLSLIYEKMERDTGRHLHAPCCPRPPPHV